MNQSCKIYEYKTLPNLVTRLRDDLNNSDFVLLYAYNGTGKTRLSMDFKEKEKVKKKGQSGIIQNLLKLNGCYKGHL